MTGASLTASGRVPKTVSTLRAGIGGDSTGRYIGCTLSGSRLTLPRTVPILASDAKEAAGLLVLVYVWHDGAAEENLSSRGTPSCPKERSTSDRSFVYL